jgi:hypothetical protein
MLAAAINLQMTEEGLRTSHTDGQVHVHCHRVMDKDVLHVLKHTTVSYNHHDAHIIQHHDSSTLPSNKCLHLIGKLLSLPSRQWPRIATSRTTVLWFLCLLPQLVTSSSLLLLLPNPFHPHAHKLHASSATQLLTLCVLLRSLSDCRTACFKTLLFHGLVYAQPTNPKWRLSTVLCRKMFSLHRLADSQATDTQGALSLVLTLGIYRRQVHGDFANFS